MDQAEVAIFTQTIEIFRCISISGTYPVGPSVKTSIVSDNSFENRFVNVLFVKLWSTLSSAAGP